MWQETPRCRGSKKVAYTSISAQFAAATAKASGSMSIPIMCLPGTQHMQLREYRGHVACCSTCVRVPRMHTGACVPGHNVRIVIHDATAIQLPAWASSHNAAHQWFLALLTCPTALARRRALTHSTDTRFTRESATTAPMATPARHHMVARAAGACRIRSSAGWRSARHVNRCNLCLLTKRCAASAVLTVCC